MTRPPTKTRPPRHRRQVKQQASDVVKVIVTGLAGSGKTSFIQSVSQYTEWQGQENNSWFFGRVRVDSSLILHFYEPPMDRQYDFMWLRQIMGRIQATGFIVMVDSTKPQSFGEFLSILYTVRGYHDDAPLVVAANKQDHRKAWYPDDIRMGLGIRDVSVQPCITHNGDTVRDVVLDLLYQLIDE